MEIVIDWLPRKDDILYNIHLITLGYMHGWTDNIHLLA